MAEVLKGKVLVAQGGGPTAVINQSIVGAVLESRKFPGHPRVRRRPRRPRHHRRGFSRLTEATTLNLEAVAQTPSSGLCSTRDKPDVEYCRKVFQVCQAHEVRYFFYIGGNDSADTCRIVNEEADKAGYELRVIHIPKTIDNDLKVTDHCPGYGSAAKFVAQAFAGVNLDNRAIPGVYIGIVMGRHAGFLTAASVLGKKYPDDGPHLVYLRNGPSTRNSSCRKCRRLHEMRPLMCRVRGHRRRKGVAIASRAEKDSHGNVQLSGTGALGTASGQGETGIMKSADTLTTCNAASSVGAKSTSSRRAKSARLF